MASFDECIESFGAIPGSVPPIPLRPGVRVLAFPDIRSPVAAQRGLLASAGLSPWHLLIDDPGQTLPALAREACRRLAVPPEGEAAFQWLPDPRRCFGSLDELIRQCVTRSVRQLAANSYDNEVLGADGIAEDDDDEDGERFVFRAITGASLAPLARKLRMVGVDCEIAGEFVRRDQPELQGLLRVRVDTRLQDSAMRRGAALGRVILTSGTRTPDSVPGVHYRLYTTDADNQFAEVLKVFGLESLVNGGGSRCGICNARQWATLCKESVSGLVPDAVLEQESKFYRCGFCKQIFWEGEKYSNNMDSLRATVQRPHHPPAPCRQAT